MQFSITNIALPFVVVKYLCVARSDNALHTSLAVDTRSIFLSYQHASDQPSDVTFNVKDLKCMVMLCEHMGANVIIRQVLKLLMPFFMPFSMMRHLSFWHTGNPRVTILSGRFDRPGMPLVAEPHFRGVSSDVDYRAGDLQWIWLICVAP